MQIIEMLIDAQANVTAKDVKNHTPLHCAARNGRVEAVRRLMDVAYEKAAQNSDKKVNENAGRRRSRDKREKRVNADGQRIITIDDNPDSDEDNENLEKSSFLDVAIWYGQR
jgi:ankyrin repeat protein